MYTFDEVRVNIRIDFCYIYSYLQRNALQKRIWSYAWDVMDDLSSVPQEYSMHAPFVYF
jgi:hypothetical protein